ncbi:GP46-like surface antigen, putative [Bodo saltans]|uniref:GP46-like surface antigen, putative n=1 Tax=Bodo saltans TaxID=75058 RepID=A0A0S4IT79_BODSA|nr:GP46-like surface antigen, putative [Bodo saltans]|eukprot:CUG06448.1 GP46-like surface antigen, putative [Bodo saltans]
MLLVVLQALVFVAVSVAAVTQHDVDIIVDFFTAASFAHSTNIETTNVCTQWPIYVRCSNQMVEAVNMSSMGLRGTLPASLGNLSTLKYFLLSRNSINGTIPKELS